MNIILDFWCRRWQSVRFDPVLGEGRLRWFSRKPANCAGWAHKHKARWYAIWRDSEDLIFQAGAERWPITDAYHCRNMLSGSTRTFSLTRDERVLLEIVYDASPDIADPAVDVLDLEMTDFFYWLAKLWNDPGMRSSVKNSWQESKTG